MGRIAGRIVRSAIKINEIVNYLLDTNIIVIYARNSEIADQIEEQYQIFNGEHNLSISVVTLG